MMKEKWIATDSSKDTGKPDAETYYKKTCKISQYLSQELAWSLH